MVERVMLLIKPRKTSQLESLLAVEIISSVLPTSFQISRTSSILPNPKIYVVRELGSLLSNADSRSTSWWRLGDLFGHRCNNTVPRHWHNAHLSLREIPLDLEWLDSKTSIRQVCPSCAPGIAKRGKPSSSSLPLQSGFRWNYIISVFRRRHWTLFAMQHHGESPIINFWPTKSVYFIFQSILEKILAVVRFENFFT